MTTATPAEQAPLNTEKEENPMAKLEIEEAKPKSPDEKSKVDEMKEKLKKPTIGASLIIFLIINTVMLCVGSATVYDCPLRPTIPIYLIVAGLLGIVTKITPILNRNRRIVIVDRILFALLLIEFIWMILGSYWIYSIYEPPYTSSGAEDHCNKTAYLLAFWLLTLHYIFLLLMIMIPCLLLSCVCWGCWAMLTSE